jgi:CIC family chloride channel protein
VGRGIALAALVGMVAGVGAVVFDLMSQFVSYFALHQAAQYKPGGPANEGDLVALILGHVEVHALIPWVLLLMPMVGGLVSGVLVYTLAPEAEGHGTDAAIEAYHHKRGVIRSRVPIVKMISSAITLGTGGSGGREGPIAQIGAGFGSFLATKLGLTDAERRVLMAAGLGAGIAAIFHAPLAGAIFAIEVLYADPDFEAEALIPAFIACTIAYCVFSLTINLAFMAAGTQFDAFQPLFGVFADLEFKQPKLLLPLTGLALVMVGMSWVYVRCFYGLTRAFARLPMPNMFKPAIGGLLTGVIALGGYFLFLNMADDRAAQDSLAVLSFGYGYLQKVLNLTPATITDVIPLISLLLFVGLGKILTTSLTIGSGGSGGVFGPSMVIGGTLGTVVGLVFNATLPNLVAERDVLIFAILGMASFFAAAANTPVSTLIMVSELTRTYELLVPSMWVCALAYLFSRGWSIYIKQVRNRIESPAHRGDFIIDVLEGLTVKEALTATGRKFTRIPVSMTLGEVVHLITDIRQTTFPVMDEQGKMVGIFGLNDVRQFLYDTEMGELATAGDLAQPFDPLSTEMVLSEAIGRFADTSFEELPVIEADDPSQVVGMIRRLDIIAAYNARLLKMRTPRQVSSFS